MAEITEEIFNDVYKKNYKFVLGRVKRVLYHTNDVDDVVQEVFIHVYNSYKTFKGNCKISTWIYYVTTNVIRNYLRFMHVKKRDVSKEIFRTTHFNIDGLPEVPKEFFIDNSISADQIRQLSLKEKTQLVVDAIERLPKNHKIVGRMMYLKHMSHKEMTKKLKCKPTYIRKMVHYVNSAIRHRLAVHQSYKEIMNEG